MYVRGLVIFFSIVCSQLLGQDPLPSWTDHGAKAKILAFVDDVNANDVPSGERIAVFDNDGTLWAEQPMYFQLQFAIDRVKDLAIEHPEWKETEPFSFVLNGELQKLFEGGHEALLTLVMGSHAGMTQTEFANIVSDWLKTARHPKTGRLYTEMVYQPMLELLKFLEANGFTNYIVSGGGIDFLRAWAQEIYGVPPEQVIGSSIEITYEVRDGQPQIARQPKIYFINDKEGKPVAISRHVGKRPLAAFGNSDGDFQMLEWTTAGDSPRFAAIVHHTDADREWAYDRESHVGQLVRGLDEAEERNWVLIDMKNDWNIVFPKK